MFSAEPTLEWNQPLIWVLTFFCLIGFQVMVAGVLNILMRPFVRREGADDSEWPAVERYPVLGLLYSFDGRIRRSTFWYALLTLSLVTWGVFGLGTGLAHWEVGAGAAIAYAIALWPLLAIHVKRCHDRGYAGIFILVNLLPIVGPIWYMVEVGFLKGTSGENRYGEAPIRLPDVI